MEIYLPHKALHFGIMLPLSHEGIVGASVSPNAIYYVIYINNIINDIIRRKRNTLVPLYKY